MPEYYFVVSQDDTEQSIYRVAATADTSNLDDEDKAKMRVVILTIATFAIMLGSRDAAHLEEYSQVSKMVEKIDSLPNDAQLIDFETEIEEINELINKS